MAPSPADKAKRLQVSLKTASGAFSEAVAVTQKAINYNLDALLKIYPDVGKIKVKNPMGTIEGQLKSGSVSLHITDNNRGMVDYYCTFKSGTMSVWIGGENDFSPPTDMTDWVFAFPVLMGQINVEEGTDEHKTIKEVINQPGDYSIMRLYIDFNTSQIASFNEKNSDFRGHKWNPDQERTSFLSLMVQWGSAVADAVKKEPRKATIGYSVKAKDPKTVNEAAPTFPPTSVKFQNYEYKGPSQDNATDGPGPKGDNNVLLYLEMTQNLSFPKEMLTYSGNFVTSDMLGTICIGRDIFFASYLLRQADTDSFLLNSINHSLYCWIEPDRHVQKDTPYPDPEKNLNIGSSNDKKPEFFAFTPVNASSTKWEWMRNDQTEDQPRSVDLQYWVDNKHTLEAKPGTNELKLSGEASIKFKNQYWTLGIPSGCEAGATASWTLDITLNSVREGGLEIKVNLPTDQSSLFHIDTFYNPWPWDSYPPYGEHLKQRLADAISAVPLSSIAEKLQKDLSSTARFVVPGGGTFLYKDPIFNNNGDVLIQSEYDGVDVGS